MKPSSLRRRMGLRDGKEFLVLEDEGNLRIIPILSDEAIRNMAAPASEVERIYRESKKGELDLEERKIKDFEHK